MMCLMKASLQRGTMKTILWACFVLPIIASVQGKINPPVDIEPKGEIAVRMGAELKIMCRMGIPLKFCRFEIPGENVNSIMLKFGEPPEDGIEYFGDGLQTGQCGLHIHKVKETHDGIFKCALTTNLSRAEAFGTMRIIVAKAPQEPQLILSSGQIGRNKYRNSEKLSISCSALYGRPAANVSLYLDNEPLVSEYGITNYDLQAGDSTLAVQNVSHSLDWSDNGKTLRCVAEHIAFDRPHVTTQQIEVFYPPQPKKTIERFGYVIGRPGVIDVTVQAHPRPRFVWRVNNEEINEEQPDKSNRLEASKAVDMGRGVYLVELKIDSVQKSDTEKEYVLKAINDEGAAEYHIKLSTSTEPEGFDLDAGYIIGIVIGVLVLLLLIFIIIFARATGRWCFAGGLSTRNIGESSDTESAGRYSRTEVDSASGRPRRPKMALSKLFRRNKDKVSGADTDTMRTIVSIGDEKIPDANEEQEKSNQPSETGLVYAELDLTKREQSVVPRRVSEDKTEYAEILYTKPEEEVTTDDRNNIK